MNKFRNEKIRVDLDIECVAKNIKKDIWYSMDIY